MTSDMKNSLFILWFFVLLLLFNGCNLDGLDFKKLSKDYGLTPEFIAPVAKANITVWDLVQSANKEKDNGITKDQNGLIKIVYTQNNLFNYDVSKFLIFPNKQVFPSEDKVLGVISPENISISTNISLNDLVISMNGALDDILPLNGMTLPFHAIPPTSSTTQYGLSSISEFTDITLSKGMLEIILENKLKIPMTIQGSLYDIVNNISVKDFTFSNIPPNGIDKKNVNLEGVRLSSQVVFRMLNFQSSGSVTPVNINLADYFKMTFNMTDLGISKGNLKIKPQTLESSSGAFGFDFPDQPGMKAFSAVLKSGSLSIKTINTSSLTGTVNFTLNEIKDKNTGKPITASISLNGNTTTIPLGNSVINFAADPAKPYNQVPYIYSLTVNGSTGYVNYSSTDIIKMEITLDNLVFQSIIGDFGKRSIQIDKGLFDLNVDMLNKIDGNFKLANPKLEMIIRNSIGMPASVGLNFIGTNKAGTTASLDPPIFDIPVPANINAGIATKNIVFNKANSNIVNFIALPPTGQISYSGKVDFNASSSPVTPQNPNFLDLNATFAIDMSMELPLELQVNKLEFKDTTGISGKDFDKIETADLILNAKNGIPLDIDLQLLFVDTISKKQYGSSKITKVLSAAQVDASGTITTTQSSNTFSLDTNEIINLRKANGIVFIGRVSSPSAGTTVAPILSTSKIELNVVIKSKVNL